MRRVEKFECRFKGESYPPYVVKRPTTKTSSLPVNEPPDVSNQSLQPRRVYQPTPPITSVPVTSPPRHRRPSLSEQLQQIGSKVDAITASLKGSRTAQVSSSTSTHVADTATATLKLQAVHVRVGRLDSRLSSTVHFYRDRCEYLFLHPFRDVEICMVMYYRDMRQLHFQKSTRTLKFKVNRRLQHFGEDYQPESVHHWLELAFLSVDDESKLRSVVPFSK